jgi:hypothetical protein
MRRGACADPLLERHAVSTADGRTPAGWYPDPAGSASQRWWDGTAWTGHLQPAASVQPAYPAQAAAPLQPAYPAQAAAPLQPAYNAQPTHDAQPTHATHGAQPTYNAQSAHDAQSAAPVHPAYSGQPSYPTQHSYPVQPDRYAYPAQQSAAATPPKVAPGTPAYGPFIWIITLLPLIGLLSLPLSLIDLEQQLSMPYPTDPSSIDPFAGMSVAALVAQGVAAVLGWVIYGVGVVLAYLDRKWLIGRGYAQPFHWAFAFLGVAAPVYAIGRSIVVRRRSGRGIAPMWVAFGIVALSFVITIVLIVHVVDLTLRTVGPMPGITA